MIKCSICSKKTASVYRYNVKSVYSAKAYDVMHCSNCGHFFTNPTFTQAELDDIYINRYSYDAHALIESEKRMRAKKYANFISKLRGVSSVLEVGCMHGLLLTELQKKGLKVSGVELDPEAVKYCQDHRLNVEQSSVEDHLKKANSKHDVVIMSHVIEHIVYPKKQLQELNKRLPKHGKILLITPNSRALTRKLFGRFWGYWQVPVHVNHFNEQSMHELLKESGFKISQTKYYGADSLFFLSTIANLLGASNDTKQLSGLRKFLVKISTVILRPWYFLGSEDMVVVASKV